MIPFAELTGAIAVAFLLTGLLAAQKNPEPAERTANPAAAAPKAPAFATCPAGALLGITDLQVQAGDQRLPFRTINHLSENDIVLYSPVLRGKEKRNGEVALVLIPEKRERGKPDILVTDTKDADKPQQWKMTETISLVALVYGPAGLNRKKVAKFLAQDEVLVAQLADYADKTTEAEQLVATLSNAESSSATVNAALSGFASQYGFAVQINKDAPIGTQAATVFQAMNPQLAAYNPLASSTAQKAGEAASMATMAGSLFFGSPVGLAAGGTAMLLDLRSIAFPDTQFRASFAQSLSGPEVNLCGQQGPVPPHTRVAYIWASRIPNIPAPPVHIGKADFIPATQKTPLPVDVPEPGWKYLDRAREWTLVGNQKKIPVSVVKLGNQHALELDLTKADLPEGDYQLTGLWDWKPFEAAGVVHVRRLSDFKQARLDPASQDRLFAKSGKIPVTVQGSDFEFITKVETERLHDEFATPLQARFLLPKGLRDGPQDHMDVQLDTEAMDPGEYKLLITQQDGKSHEVDFKVLANPPRIENLPILVNQGSLTQHFVLKGQRLEQLARLESPGAELNLQPAQGVNQTERSLTVQLKSTPRPGSALPARAWIENRSEPLSFPDALQITGPLPVIASSKLSPPAGLSVAMHADEFPAGYTLNAMLDVKNIELRSTLRLSCAGGVGQETALHIGEQTSTWNLQQLSPDQLFLAFDTSQLPAGCSLQAVIDNGRDGSSQPLTLVRIIRVPQIDSLTLAEPELREGTRSYQLTGRNLEMIDKLGWDDQNGAAIAQLPTPLPGPGLKQSIQTRLPDPPSAGAFLHVWLRADHQGRATTIKAPALPLQPPASITVTSSANPAVPGEAVTLAARIDPPDATGTITFKNGNTSIGSAPVNAGEASLSVSNLPAGTFPITAAYSGDTKFAAANSAPLAEAIRKASTTTEIKSDPNPSTAGQAVTFTATVTAAGSNQTAPAGTVSFQIDDQEAGTGTVDANGTATFSMPSLKAGTHTVKAVYSGSQMFDESTSPALTQVVN